MPLIYACFHSDHAPDNLGYSQVESFTDIFLLIWRCLVFVVNMSLGSFMFLMAVYNL